MDLNVFEPYPVMEQLYGWMTPEDRASAEQFGSKYDHYCGYGYYLEPQAVLEIGVKHGYSIASICYGAWNRSSPPMFVKLIDNQQAGGDLGDVALRLKKAFPRVNVIGERAESQKAHVGPHAAYDLIHVDASHEEEDCYHDLVRFARCLMPGGMIVVDDTDDANVMHSCERFMIEEEEAGRPWDFRIIPCTCGHVLMTRI